MIKIDKGISIIIQYRLIENKKTKILLILDYLNLVELKINNNKNLLYIES